MMLQTFLTSLSIEGTLSSKVPVLTDPQSEIWAEAMLQWSYLGVQVPGAVAKEDVLVAVRGAS